MNSKHCKVIFLLEWIEHAKHHLWSFHAFRKTTSCKVEKYFAGDFSSIVSEMKIFGKNETVCREEEEGGSGEI